MKMLPLLAIFIATITTVSAQGVEELLADAQRAYLRGDLAVALEKFELVRKVDPNNRTAIVHIRRIAAEKAKEDAQKGPANATKSMLDAIVLPKVNFKETSLAEALEFLRQKGNAAGEGKVAINFVLLIDEKTKAVPITLSLQNVPITEVLRYIGQLGNVEFTYDRFAITVKPKGAAEAQPAAQPDPAK